MVTLILTANLPGGLVVFGLAPISGANQKKNQLCELCDSNEHSEWAVNNEHKMNRREI